MSAFLGAVVVSMVVEASVVVEVSVVVEASVVAVAVSAAVAAVAAVAVAAALAALAASELALVVLALASVLFNLVYSELHEEKLFYEECAPATCAAGALLFYVYHIGQKIVHKLIMHKL